jgi:hypothetical protein
MLNFLFKYSYLFLIFLFFSVIFIYSFFNELKINTNFYYIFWILLLPFLDKILDYIKKDFSFIETNNKNFYLRIFIFSLITFFLIFFNISIINFLILIFILFSFLFNLDSRITFLIALILLFYTVYSIWIWNKKLAETFSIYAYYFLIIWVFQEIIISLFFYKNLDE